MNLAQIYFCFILTHFLNANFEKSQHGCSVCPKESFFFRPTDPSNFGKNPCSRKLNWSGLNWKFHVLMLTLLSNRIVSCKVFIFELHFSERALDFFLIETSHEGIVGFSCVGCCQLGLQPGNLAQLGQGKLNSYTPISPLSFSRILFCTRRWFILPTHHSDNTHQAS